MGVLRIITIWRAPLTHLFNPRFAQKTLKNVKIAAPKIQLLHFKIPHLNY